MTSPDLNIDLGELPDEPAELYSLAHRVNVACGGHAGDVSSMQRACEQARRSGALIGAHPSYEDRARFGRVVIELSAEALRTSLVKQCRALRTLTENVAHLKPHGALYHEADRRREVADIVIDVARTVLGPVTIIGPPNGALCDAASEAGLAFLAEGFADRRYRSDGSLTPRGEVNALITHPGEAAQRARQLAASGRYATLCVHSDTPGAVEIARAVRAALDAR